MIINMIRKEADKSLTSVTTSHYNHNAGMNIRSRAIFRRLNEVDFKCLSPFLTPRHRNVCLSRENSLLNYNRNHMIVNKGRCIVCLRSANFLFGNVQMNEKLAEQSNSHSK